MGLALEKDHTRQQTVVIGLGETGLSVAKFLDKHGVDFKVVDTRLNPPQYESFKHRFPNIEVQLGELSSDSFAKAQQIIVSPGIDIQRTEIRDVVETSECECIGDIELFARCTKKPIVAITGSNGKSTVTSLLASMANMSGVKTYAGGNLGPPALDLLCHDDAELFVLELSSFQLESTTTLCPQVSAVLNISADHLDRHGDINNYARIKEKIYSNSKISVINRDDKHVANMKTCGDVISFGLDAPANYQFGIIKRGKNTFLAYGDKGLLNTNELALTGESGALNSLAALAIGHALALSTEKMLIALKNFKELPHRLSLVSKVKGVSWYNDSKGTNIGATLSSLRSLHDHIVLIAGGVFKGGDLSLLSKAVSEHVKHVILLGQDAGLLKQALIHATTISTVDTMQQAVKLAEEISVPGDKVLLSPACASFDMYKNYIERGNDFENCVKDLL